MLTATYGGVAPRWRLRYSEPRRPQAPRTVDTHWRQQREAAAQAWQQLCRTACACEADAQQALATCAQGLQVTSLHQGTIHPPPRDDTRGRPRPGAQPDQGVSPIAGALASSRAARAALGAQRRGFILATHARDDHT